MGSYMLFAVTHMADFDRHRYSYFDFGMSFYIRGITNEVRE